MANISGTIPRMVGLGREGGEAIMQMAIYSWGFDGAQRSIYYRKIFEDIDLKTTTEGREESLWSGKTIISVS